MAYEFEKEILEAGVANVIPSYAPISETYFYLQEATERDFLELAYDIGIKELGILEATGSELLFEADGEEGKKVKNGLVAKLQSAWARIKQAIDKFLKIIQEKIATAKKHLTDAVLKKVKARLANNDSEGKVINYGKFYTYAGLKSSMKIDSGSLINDSEEEIQYDEEYLRGKEVPVNKAYISKNFDYIVNCALDFKFTKSQILQPYNEVKKVFDKNIKDAKSNNVDKEEINKIKASITSLNKIASAIVKAFHERQRLALGILTKVAVDTLRNTKKLEAKKAAKTENKAKNNEEAKEEHVAASYTDPEGTPVVESYTSEINKLFDWSF